jgi:hypothetical protein
MDTAYLERNRKGFEGDEYIFTQIKQLVELCGIEQIIETGTFHGWTTKRLAELAPVISCEINEQFHEIAKMNIGHVENITLVRRSSPLLLNQIADEDNQDDKKSIPNRLFFLDAHWQEHCPLLDELAAIAKMKGKKPVIVIHDFKVPDKPEFGFDTYKNQDLDWPYIEKSIKAIYGETELTFFYNSQASGAMRGVIYILPYATMRSIDEIRA